MGQAAVSSTVVYRDPKAALDWLAKAFGFEVSLLVQVDEHERPHATLEGQCTQFIGIALESGLDAHCETARAAGAKITEEPADQFYGARSYRAMDPEGHVWTFRQELRRIPTAELEATSGLTYKVGG